MLLGPRFLLVAMMLIGPEHQLGERKGMSIPVNVGLNVEAWDPQLELVIDRLESTFCLAKVQAFLVLNWNFLKWTLVHRFQQGSCSLKIPIR